MAVGAPVGGLSRPQDFVPSVFFAVAHFVLLPAFIYRFTSRDRFSSLIIGSAGYTVERIVLFSLRAVVAKRQGTESEGLSDYLQVALAMGTIYISSDIAKLLRCILVNSTYSQETHPRMIESQLDAQEPDTDAEKQPLPFLIYEGNKPKPKDRYCQTMLDTLPIQSACSLPDQPRRRFWFRRFDDVMLFIHLTCMGLGFYANSSFKESGSRTRQVLRYMATCTYLSIGLFVFIGAWLAHHRLTRINKMATQCLMTICVLFCIPAIYRLCVYESVSDYHNTRFDQPKQKILFYVFHIAPDFVNACIFSLYDIRQIFATGSGGDQYWVDETAEQRQKRREKARDGKEKKRQKKAARQAMQPQSLPSWRPTFGQSSSSTLITTKY